MAQGALPWKEGICILSRCHRDLPWAETASHLTGLSLRLYNSGYTHKYMDKIIQSALDGFAKIMTRAEQGGRPLDRPDSMDRSKRSKDKVWQAKSLYRRGGHTTTLFVPPTPGSILAQRLQKAERRDSQGRGWSVRVVERPGQTIRSRVQTPIMACQEPCSNTTCIPCKGRNQGVCRKNSIVYRLQCTQCASQHQGATQGLPHPRDKQPPSSLQAPHHLGSPTPPMWAKVGTI